MLIIDMDAAGRWAAVLFFYWSFCTRPTGIKANEPDPQIRSNNNNIVPKRYTVQECTFLYVRTSSSMARLFETIILHRYHWGWETDIGRPFFMLLHTSSSSLSYSHCTLKASNITIHFSSSHPTFSFLYTEPYIRRTHPVRMSHHLPLFTLPLPLRRKRRPSGGPRPRLPLQPYQSLDRLFSPRSFKHTDAACVGRCSDDHNHNRKRGLETVVIRDHFLTSPHIAKGYTNLDHTPHNRLSAQLPKLRLSTKPCMVISATDVLNAAKR